LTLQEYIPLGQRIKIFSVEYWNGNAWQFVDRQTTIGYKRILRFPSVTAQKVRVKIEEALACPVLSTIAVFNAPELLSPVAIMRDKKGMVSIACESKDPVIFYTIDGGEPTVNSQRYVEPFALPAGGTVMAKAFINNNTQSSETVREDFDIAPIKWSVVSPEGRGYERAIDGNPYSSCVLPENNSAIVISLGAKFNLKGFTYHPVAGSSGNIQTYNFYTGMDGKRWKKQMNNASFDNIQNNPVLQSVRFEKSVDARFIKLEAIRTVEPEKRAIIGEIGIISK
jgi:alpha-L-fucosidase